jgi:hypothetical protein
LENNYVAYIKIKTVPFNNARKVTHIKQWQGSSGSFLSDGSNMLLMIAVAQGKEIS